MLWSENEIIGSPTLADAKAIRRAFWLQVHTLELSNEETLEHLLICRTGIVF